MSLETQSAIRVDRVTKSYATVRAVRELSFDVRRGDVFALLGPNGAGKTTLVRMLVGILQPDSGTIAFDGSLGYLPEERGLHRDTPVLRTLEYFGVLNGMDRGEARRVALDALERFQLKGREKDRVDSLSKGNQQKVQYLAAVLHRPRVAVLDEPFSGLDPINQQRFVDEILRLRDEGCTILLSAHQMDLVESVADRLLLINEGQAVLHGTLEEIRRTTGSGVQLKLGVADEADVDLARLEGMEGVESVEAVTSVSPVSPTLLSVRLQPDFPVGTALHALTEALPIVSVQSAEESLREIFLRTVGKPAKTAGLGSSDGVVEVEG